MTTVEILRPYVMEQVASLLGVEQVKLDEQGDIPIRRGSAVVFGRLMEGPSGPMFRLFSPLLGGLDKSPNLMERLNQLNMESPYVRFFWVDEHVYCAMDMLAEELQPKEIGNAIEAMTWNSDRLDDLLKADFGGERMVEESEAPKPPTQGDGGYL